MTYHAQHMISDHCQYLMQLENKFQSCQLGIDQHNAECYHAAVSLLTMINTCCLSFFAPVAT